MRLNNRTRSHVFVVVAVATTAFTVACSSGASGPTSDASPQDTPSQANEGPRLLVSPPANAGMEAIVSGRLGINDVGCFTVAGLVLIAPSGSSVLDTGDGVRIPGIGEIRLDGQVSTSGGYLPAAELSDIEGLQECIQDASTEVAIISPPT